MSAWEMLGYGREVDMSKWNGDAGESTFVDMVLKTYSDLVMEN